MTVRATGSGTAARRSVRAEVGPVAPADGVGTGCADGLVDDLVDDLVEEIDEELDTLDERRVRARRDPAVELAMAPARRPAVTGRPAAGAGSRARVRPAQERTATPVGRAGEGLLAPGVPGVNEVRIVGRVSTDAEELELPSGDLLVSLRVVVPRPASRTVGDRRRPRVPVDTIEVACWSAMTRRRALRLEGGDLVEVTGSLRRRFYRAGTVSLSRYEVEARTLRRVREVAPTQEAVGEAVGE